MSSKRDKYNVRLLGGYPEQPIYDKPSIKSPRKGVLQNQQYYNASDGYGAAPTYSPRRAPINDSDYEYYDGDDGTAGYYDNSSSSSSSSPSVIMNQKSISSSMRSGGASSNGSSMRSRAQAELSVSFASGGAGESSVQQGGDVGYVISKLRVRLEKLKNDNTRLNDIIATERIEKCDLETKNDDLNSKLIEARSGLRETRSALLNVQSATEQLMKKREDRDMQLRKVVDINRTLENRVRELEDHLKKADTIFKNQAAELLSQQKKFDVEKKKLLETIARHADTIRDQDSKMDHQKSAEREAMESKRSLNKEIITLRDSLEDIDEKYITILESIARSLYKNHKLDKSSIEGLIHDEDLLSKMSCFDEMRSNSKLSPRKVVKSPIAQNYSSTQEDFDDSLSDNKNNNNNNINSSNDNNDSNKFNSSSGGDTSNNNSLNIELETQMQELLSKKLQEISEENDLKLQRLSSQIGAKVTEIDNMRKVEIENLNMSIMEKLNQQVGSPDKIKEAIFVNLEAIISEVMQHQNSSSSSSSSSNDRGGSAKELSGKKKSLRTNTSLHNAGASLASVNENSGINDDNSKTVVINDVVNKSNSQSRRNSDSNNDGNVENSSNDIIINNQNSDMSDLVDNVNKNANSNDNNNEDNEDGGDDEDDGLRRRGTSEASKEARRMSVLNQQGSKW